MSIFKMLASLVVLQAATMAAHAGEQTMTLKVEGMTCGSCPYQVKKSLTGIEGVKAAEVSLESKLATVTFDDEKTDVAALTAATADVGFPSSPVE
jgi:mercuric ion binding protein